MKLQNLYWNPLQNYIWTLALIVPFLTELPKLDNITFDSVLAYVIRSYGVTNAPIMRLQQFIIETIQQIDSSLASDKHLLQINLFC